MPGERLGGAVRPVRSGSADWEALLCLSEPYPFAMLASMAASLLGTEASMTAPCSVNA